MVGAFESEPLLCPVLCFQEYKARTREFRSSDTYAQLFLAVVKPHKLVTSETIARWIKRVLLSSGVDIHQFLAHSTRSVATSAAAKAGISTQEIMARVGWSNEGTHPVLTTHHPRKVSSAEAFGSAVLQAEHQNT